MNSVHGPGEGGGEGLENPPKMYKQNICEILNGNPGAPHLNI